MMALLALSLGVIFIALFVLWKVLRSLNKERRNGYIEDIDECQNNDLEHLLRTVNKEH